MKIKAIPIPVHVIPVLPLQHHKLKRLKDIVFDYTTRHNLVPVPLLHKHSLIIKCSLLTLINAQYLVGANILEYSITIQIMIVFDIPNTLGLSTLRPLNYQFTHYLFLYLLFIADEITITQNTIAAVITSTVSITLSRYSLVDLISIHVATIRQLNITRPSITCIFTLIYQ